MREPRDINIGQVVRDTENQLGVIGCLERKGYCPIERRYGPALCRDNPFDWIVDDLRQVRLRDPETLRDVLDRRQLTVVEPDLNEDAQREIGTNR
jgi:DNA-binding IscR family transcriptional regulator